MRKKINETVVSGEAWFSAIEKIWLYWPQFLGLAGMTGLGTWFASGWNALSGQGWGIYPLVGAGFALGIALAFAAFAYAMSYFSRRPAQSASSANAAHAHQSTGAVSTKKTEYVQFRLPTNWEVGLGFKLATLPADEATGTRDQAEEVYVFILVTQRMQNAKFELRASRQRADGWETIATIGSAMLAGTVHKEIRQSFLVMRRQFRTVSAQFDNPFLGTQQSVRIRAEKDVIIFPENPAAFPATLGEQYHFRITIYHDDGPERASFVLNLHPTLDVPQSRLTNLENIEPIFSNRPI